MHRSIISVVLLSACASSDKESPSTTLATCDITPLDPGQLTTADGFIVDENGRRMLLRGINTGGRSKFAPFSPFDYDEERFQEELDIYLDRPAEWGLNVLRVPFSWDAMEPEQGVFDEEWMARYDALLDGAADRGSRAGECRGRGLRRRLALCGNALLILLLLQWLLWPCDDDWPCDSLAV